MRCDCSWCLTQPLAFLWHPAPITSLSRDPAQLNTHGTGPGDTRLSLLGPLGDLPCLVCAMGGTSGSGHFLVGLWAVCHSAFHPMWHFSPLPGGWCETLHGGEPASARGVGGPVAWLLLCSYSLLLGEEGDAFGTPFSVKTPGSPECGWKRLPLTSEAHLPLCTFPVPLPSWTELLEVWTVDSHCTSRVQQRPWPGVCLMNGASDRGPTPHTNAVTPPVLSESRGPSPRARGSVCSFFMTVKPSAPYVLINLHPSSVTYTLSFR